MTNYEKIHSMSFDELVRWLEKTFTYSEPPWTLWFDKKYCQRCAAEKATYVDSDKELDFAYCELHDTCRFFDSKMDNRKIIEMWFDLDCEDN